MDYGVENFTRLATTKKIGDGDLTLIATEILADIANSCDDDKKSAEADVAKSRLTKFLREERPEVHRILMKCFAPFYGD